MECLVLIACIVGGYFLILFMIDEGKINKEQQKKAREERLRTQSRNFDRASMLNNNLRNSIDKFVNSDDITYKQILSETDQELQNLYSCSLITEYANDDKDIVINNYNCRKEEIELIQNKFGNVSSLVDKSYIFSEELYGKCDKSAFESLLKNVTSDSANNVILFSEKQMEKHDVNEFIRINSSLAAGCLWHYAITKPFDSEQFTRATKIYKYVHREIANIEPFIAEMYARNQMGSKDLVRAGVNDYIKHTDEKYTQNFAILAAALMWMGAYEAEEIVLKRMLELKLPMNQKMQERLHSLSNRKGDAPDAIEMNDSAAGNSFDISSVAWKDGDYDGFFDNLSFRDMVLNYSLAVREDDKSVMIGMGKKIKSLSDISRIICDEMDDEYGEDVTVSMKNMTAISAGNEQKMEGVLVTVDQFDFMSVFMYLIPVGKKLNIKFYTLYVPTGSNNNEQHQQIMSLAKKLNPDVTMWEDSIKETLLFAIQKYLHTEQQAGPSTVQDFSEQEMQDEIEF